MSAEGEPHGLNHITSLILVTGISGAGRSSALADLSDMGYYTIDNLPVPLFPAFLEFTRTRSKKYDFTALTVDTDSHSKVSELLELLQGMNRDNIRLLFLESDTEVILKRYSETRRPHPYFNPNRDTSLEDTIQRERDRLEPLKYRANLTIDTTSLTVHDLKRELRQFVGAVGATPNTVRVNFVSFGFKYGPPRDCDLIIDIRFLPNPHFVPELKPKVGLDPAVAAYVLQSPDGHEFLGRYTDLLNYLLPQYGKEGKAYVNIGIGCTGGRHRSVAIAEALHDAMSLEGFTFGVRHRDITR